MRACGLLYFIPCRRVLIQSKKKKQYLANIWDRKFTEAFDSKLFDGSLSPEALNKLGGKLVHRVIKNREK